jgi:four helix bundle protein
LYEGRISDFGFRIENVEAKMDRNELERRTKASASRVIRFVAELPRNRVSDVLGRQLMRAGTSIGANNREANRAESRADFIHKMGLAEKEAAETQYWLELLEEEEMGNREERRWLLQESGELLAIFSSIGRTSKSRGRTGGSGEDSKCQIGSSRSEIRNPKLHD